MTARYNRVKALKVNYINIVLDGFDSGDTWFDNKLEEIQKWWPALVDQILYERYG